MTELERTSFVGQPVAMGFKIEQLLSEGWEIDEDHPLTFWIHGQLVCHFVRDPANAKDAPPKLSRAEILAKARAAKAAKKEASE